MSLSVITVALTVQVAFARVGMLTCNNKADCLEGYTCIGNVCKKCVKCELLFRLGTSCVTDLKECGHCLEGYEELLITDFSSVIKPCTPVKKKVKYKQCTDDQSCPPDKYCNEKLCVNCFDCNLLNRQTPPAKCAHSINECGFCLPGFYEVAVTTEINAKPCEKENYTVHEVHSSIVPFSDLVPGFLSLAFFCFVIIIIFIRKYTGQSSEKTTHHQQIYPSAPPLCGVESLQYVRKLEDNSVVTFVKEKKQEAKVFKLPSAPYYYSGGEENDLTDEPAETNEDSTLTLSDTPARSQLAQPSQPEDEDCSDTILEHRYIELGISDDLLSLQSAEIQLEEISLDMVDTPQTSENTVCETSQTTQMNETEVRRGEEAEENETDLS